MTPRLLETMHVEDGHVALLGRHLARLEAAASSMEYPADLEAARDLIALEADRQGRCGLRLTLGPDDLALEAFELPSTPLRTVWIDREPVLEAGSWRCTLKTTHRDHYRERHGRALEVGADEAILVNDRGEVTEGTRTNVWVEAGGRLWTPPLDAGGLGGVYRAYVLEVEPRAAERSLTLDDLEAADAVFLSNALRGWMPVTIVRDSE